jgi:hypothetical protein
MWPVLIVVVLAAADTLQSTPPRAPHEAWGACPFECCTYGNWTATARVSIRRDRRANAPVVFQVASGERVAAVTGVVIASRLGTARAKADGTIFESGVPVKKGTVTVLHYVGEGHWQIWINGITDTWEIDESTEAPFSYQTLRMVSPPKTTWWVQIRNGKGQVGWTTRVDDFTGKDRCGGS